jgi:hypothetical protein
MIAALPAEDFVVSVLVAMASSTKPNTSSPNVRIRSPPVVPTTFSICMYVSVSAKLVTPCATSLDFNARISSSAAP